MKKSCSFLSLPIFWRIFSQYPEIWSNLQIKENFAKKGSLSLFLEYEAEIIFWQKKIQVITKFISFLILLEKKLIVCQKKLISFLCDFEEFFFLIILLFCFFICGMINLKCFSSELKSFPGLENQDHIISIKTWQKFLVFFFLNPPLGIYIGFIRKR